MGKIIFATRNRGHTKDADVSHLQGVLVISAAGFPFVGKGVYDAKKHCVFDDTCGQYITGDIIVCVAPEEAVVVIQDRLGEITRACMTTAFLPLPTNVIECLSTSVSYDVATLKAVNDVLLKISKNGGNK